MWAKSLYRGNCIKNAGNILLVIDEEVMLDFVHGMLNSLGYYAISYVNSADAVEAYRFTWNEIDLVVVDLAIPSTKGVETVDALYQINPDANILVASGVVPEENTREIALIRRIFDRRFKKGKNGLAFIEKPYRMSELSRKINRLAPAGLHGLRQELPISYGS